MYRKIMALLLSLTVFVCTVPIAVTAATTDMQKDLLCAVTEGETKQLYISAQVDGDYCLEFTYRCVSGRQISPEVAITLEGNGVKYSSNVEFTRKWVDEHFEGRFKKDKFGNEITPISDESVEWQTLICGINAETGSKPVNLKHGEYRLSLVGTCESVEISAVNLYQKSLTAYKDYIQSFSNAEKDNNNSQKANKYEAEIMYAKSNSSIIPTYDRSSPSISPNYSNKIALNIVGGSSFYDYGQWIEWEIDTADNGFYVFDFRYQQDSLRGIGVGRRIMIDGVVPFEEFDNVLFPYAQNYTTMRLADKNGDAYKVYLNKGKHIIRMQVNFSHLEQEILDLQSYIENCNSMYRKIISITGAAPDVYRDYYLDKELPELMPFISGSIKELERISKNIEVWSDEKGGSEVSSIDDMVRVLKKFEEKPYKIPASLDNFKNGIDSVANLIVTLSSQSLTLDYFNVSPKNSDLTVENSGFFGYIIFRLKSFINSFVNDYTVFSGDENKNIDVWVNMGDVLVSGAASGRDQMQIIKRLCDDSFTEKYNVGVKFSLVSAGDTLVQAILADKGPDCALFVGEQTVVNLAIRGVLADISENDWFKERKVQYNNSSFIPFTFNNKVYAMPETQTFNMMFYRSDVFDELGIKPPQTWEEFFEIQKVLVQHKLDIGIPANQEIFEMLLLQNGGDIYTPDLSGSNLREECAVESFSLWTDLYVKHSLPLEFNFFNRFRTGEMPLGIMGYTMYNQLSIAAPEIEGMWEMVSVPGTRRSDGSIDRSQSSVNVGCIVIKKSANLNEANTFVNWWSDSTVQLNFGRQVETVLGKSARYNTANTVAFENLNWTKKQRDNIILARNEVSDIRQTAVSYYVSRCVMNAFRRVVYNYENTRDVLYRYSDDIDRELVRKNKVMKKETE